MSALDSLSTDEDCSDPEKDGTVVMAWIVVNVDLKRFKKCNSRHLILQAYGHRNGSVK